MAQQREITPEDAEAFGKRVYAEKGAAHAERRGGTHRLLLVR